MLSFDNADSGIGLKSGDISCGQNLVLWVLAQRLPGLRLSFILSGLSQSPLTNSAFSEHALFESKELHQGKQHFWA